MANKKTLKKLQKVNSFENGRELFNNVNWYRINRLMIFNISVYDSVIFSFLADVEQSHKSSESEQMKKDDYYFLCTSEFIENQLNIPNSTQKKYLGNLVKIGFIKILHSVGNKRMIKIIWPVFMKEYKKWVIQYENELDELKTKRTDINKKIKEERIKKQKINLC